MLRSILFSLAALSIMPASAAERKLDGDEISALLSAIVATGENTRQTFTKAGATTYNDAGRESFGRWRVQSNRYCSTWPPSDTWACYDVVIDEAASPKTLIWVGDSGKRLVNHYQAKK